jgi:peptidylprolyl isomerase
VRRLLLVAILLAACGSKKEKPRAAATADAATDKKARPGRNRTQVKPPFPLDATPEGAQTLPDGLVFKSITEGTGETPGPNDGVQVRYSAWRMDGTTFATTEPSDQPTTMWLYAIAPGFTEALRMMKVGGKAMFWVPPEIGYPGGKPKGKPERLAYSAELVAVIRAPATPPDVAGPPKDAKTAKAGGRWMVVKRGEGGKERARPWDEVAVAYTGWDRTGKLLNSTELQGKPVVAPAENLPAIFREVIPQLAVGDRARFWFPATMLANVKDPPEGDVCYEAELVSITRLAEPPPVPPDVAAPPKDAKQTPKGAFYRVLKSGGGTQIPTSKDTITAHLTGWTSDGKRFESTIPKGTPKTWRVVAMIPGLTDAFLLMPVGDTWRIWVPENLAYAGGPGRPQGMLVFDVTMVSIDRAGAGTATKESGAP